MVVGGFYYAAMDDLISTQFFEVMREDVSVSFRTPRPERAARELAHLPGVVRAEGLRVVPVRFLAGHLSREGLVWGYPDDAELRSLRDKFGRPQGIPAAGLVLTDKLAEILHVGIGDRVMLQVEDGERPRRSVTVTGLIDEAFGLQGHMRLDALRELLGEERLISLALLRIDPLFASEIDARLADTPHVSAVTHRSDALARFEEQSAGMILTFSIIITLFAATITVGVVYNNARIVLSQRARDLASLRVLGFTRREISSILLGEMAIQVLLALPLGLAFGRLLVWLLAQTVDPEVYRLPFEVPAQSNAFAVIVALCASLLSALLVRRKLDRLDLIGVLKTRE
jgi:putative ABC transport system permease protein